MRKVALVGVICALGVGLGGCRTIPTTEGDANLGCKESFRQTASWKIKGFEIPFQSKLIGTVKIGEVEYSPEQAQKISDTIRMLDQARLGNCSLTTSNNFRLLSQETRDQIFLKASAGYGAIIDFAAGLEKAKTVDEGRSAQDKAAGEIPKVKPPIEPPKPVALVDSQAREAAAEVGASLVNLRSEVLKLSQAIDEVLGRGVQRIEVSGFAPDGSALLAEQRLDNSGQVQLRTPTESGPWRIEPDPNCRPRPRPR